MLYGHLYVYRIMSVLIFCPFFDWVVYLFFILNCMNCLYILESNPLSVTSFANTSPILQVVLVFFYVFFFFPVQKFLSLIGSRLFVFHLFSLL